MTARDLIALLPGPAPHTLPRGTRAAQADGVTAIFGASRLSGLKTSRKSALKGAVQRQERLEALMPAGTVLPVIPGTYLSPSDLPTLVACNRDMLNRLFAALSGLVQYQLSVTWDRAAATARFGTTDDSLEALAAQLRAEMMAHLTVADDLQELPRSEDAVLNTVLLVNEPTDLDPALEAIDAIWTEGLRIRLIGPSPAVSFASLHLRHATAGQVAAARATLGLRELPDGLDTLSAARRAAVMAAPPEMQVSLREASDLLSAAIRAGGQPPILADVWREGRAASDLNRKDAA
ncbi:MAG: GvpL/GvpF family gas vesicle protein [Pseudomonadota bacterium]